MGLENCCGSAASRKNKSEHSLSRHSQGKMHRSTRLLPLFTPFILFFFFCSTHTLSLSIPLSTPVFRTFAPPPPTNRRPTHARRSFCSSRHTQASTVVAAAAAAALCFSLHRATAPLSRRAPRKPARKCSAQLSFFLALYSISPICTVLTLCRALLAPTQPAFADSSWCCVAAVESERGGPTIRKSSCC